MERESNLRKGPWIQRLKLIRHLVVGNAHIQQNALHRFASLGEEPEQVRRVKTINAHGSRKNMVQVDHRSLGFRAMENIPLDRP